MEIDRCTEDDLPRVADLHVQAFLGSREPASERVQSFLHTFFFEHPWRADGLLSLVARDRAGVVQGFIGVIPRPMVWKRRTIRAAISSRLVVAPDLRDPSCALRLVKHFLEGPQELSISDSASPASRRLLEACGGVTAPSRCMNWLRLLRPLSQGAAWAAEGWRLVPLVRLASPALRALDATLSALPKYPLALPPVSSVAEAADDAALLASVEACSRTRALRPSYNSKAFSWLLDRLREDRQRGELRAAVVRRSDGALLGSSLHYARRGMAEVLQVAAAPGAAREVLLQLLHQAHREGATAVLGRFDPALADDIWSLRCTLTRGHAAVFHSPNLELLHAILVGDAFLTATEGELFLPSPMQLR